MLPPFLMYGNLFPLFFARLYIITTDIPKKIVGNFIFLWAGTLMLQCYYITV